MANRNGEPPPTAKVQLTDIQRDRIEHARIDLANSAADETGDHSLEHQAVLEYRLEQMLALGVFDAVEVAIRDEVAVARVALAEWPGLAPTQHLLALGDVLLAQVASLRPVG